MELCHTAPENENLLVSNFASFSGEEFENLKKEK